MKDEVAVVTGGGKGIGRAICFALAEAGASIAVTDIRKSLAAKTCAEVRERWNVKALPVEMNVASADSIKRAIRAIFRSFPTVHVLINNAGIVTVSPFLQLTEREWNLAMNVNAKGVFLCSQLFAREMVKRDTKGRIVNISSIAGKIALEYQAHYCASKAAVLGVTRASALELAPYGIRVNAICPGAVDTDLLEECLRETARIEGKTTGDLVEAVSTSTLVRRLIRPEEIAKMVVFLCGGDASGITGQAMNVDGGNLQVNY